MLLLPLGPDFNAAHQIDPCHWHPRADAIPCPGGCVGHHETGIGNEILAAVPLLRSGTKLAEWIDPCLVDETPVTVRVYRLDGLLVVSDAPGPEAAIAAAVAVYPVVIEDPCGPGVYVTLLPTLALAMAFFHDMSHMCDCVATAGSRN